MNKPYSHLANAIKWGLLASTAVMAAPTFAAGDNDSDVERIEVTGSRIKRSDLEGASPVIAISREDIEKSGDITVADVLRQNTLNTFGSFNERSGSTAQSQATISLRGVGEDRTLVLINGKRQPGSPTLGGTAVNINTLPMAAVERIEIMSDGGSAVYGSDAVAGVVNIILRKDFEGTEIKVGAGRPDNAGGDESNFSLVTGTSSDKSNTVVAFDHEERGLVYNRDRDYTRSTNLGADSYFDTTGLSTYARNIQDANGVLRPLASCVGNPSMVQNGKIYDYGDGDRVCAYDPTELSATAASLKKDNLYVHNAYNITNDLVFNSQAMISRVESYGQYAGAAGSFTAAVPLAAIDADGNQVIVNNGKVLYRFDEVGPRKTTVTDEQQDVQFSLNGSESWGEWDLGAHYNRTDSRSDGDGYVNRPIVEMLVKSGDFNFNGNSREVIDAITQSTLQKDNMEFLHFNAGASFDVDAGLAAPLAFYVGGESMSYDYSTKVDAQSAAGNVIGSAGGNSGGDRDVNALFMEMSAPLTDTLELNFALRYDDYSDFGSATTPKLSASWRPLDGLVVRASVGQGFRAPSLSDLFSSPSFSADTAADYVYCDANGTPRADCKAQQYDVTRTANEQLDAEESDFYNFGVAYDFNENVGAKLDYYNLKIDDVITLVSLQDLVVAEGAGVSLPGTFIKRTPNGKIESAQTAMVNGGKLETSGVDFTVYGKVETGVGNFNANLQTTYVIDYKEPEYFLGPMQDKIGQKGLPEYRATLDLGWKYDVHSLNWQIDHIADTKEFIDENYRAYGHLPSWTTHTVSYTNNLPWNADINVGIRNVFDKDPVLDSSNEFDNSLYNLWGRVYFANYTQRF